MKTKVISLVLLSVLMFPIMAKSQVKIKQTAGRDALGEFAPEFARLNDDVLFGEVWSRNDLLSLQPALSHSFLLLQRSSVEPPDTFTSMLSSSPSW